MEIQWFIAGAGAFFTIMLIVVYVVGRRDGALDENLRMREESTENSIEVRRGDWTPPYMVDSDRYKYVPSAWRDGKW